MRAGSLAGSRHRRQYFAQISSPEGDVRCVCEERGPGEEKHARTFGARRATALCLCSLWAAGARNSYVCCYPTADARTSGEHWRFVLARSADLVLKIFAAKTVLLVTKILRRVTLLGGVGSVVNGVIKDRMTSIEWDKADWHRRQPRGCKL